jgi:CCCH-type zinc finger
MRWRSSPWKVKMSLLWNDCHDDDDDDDKKQRFLNDLLAVPLHCPFLHPDIRRRLKEEIFTNKNQTIAVKKTLDSPLRRAVNYSIRCRRGGSGGDDDDDSIDSHSSDSSCTTVVVSNISSRPKRRETTAVTSGSLATSAVVAVRNQDTSTTDDVQQHVLSAFLYDCFVRFDAAKDMILRASSRTSSAYAAVSQKASACSQPVKTPPSSLVVATMLSCTKVSIKTTTNTKTTAKTTSTEEERPSPFNTFGRSPYVSAALSLGFSTSSPQKKQSVGAASTACSPFDTLSTSSLVATSAGANISSTSTLAAVTTTPTAGPTPFGTSTTPSSVPFRRTVIQAATLSPSPFTKQPSPYGTASTSMSPCSPSPKSSSLGKKHKSPKILLGLKHKSRPCKFLVNGSCKYGSNCSYSHDTTAYKQY